MQLILVKNIPVLLNPAPATKDLDIEEACKCEFFVPNETELAILTDMPVNTDDEIKNAAEYLVNKGLKNVIVTMGSRGAMWVTKENCQYLKSFKVNAVDTSGAGDAFIGCFASCYVKNNDVMLSMKEASAFAALSVTKKGTQISYPTKDQVKEFLSKYNKE